VVADGARSHRERAAGDEVAVRQRQERGHGPAEDAAAETGADRGPRTANRIPRRDVAGGNTTGDGEQATEDDTLGQGPRAVGIPRRRGVGGAVEAGRDAGRLPEHRALRGQLRGDGAGGERGEGHAREQVLTIKTLRSWR
jgi:hypothetical protein